MTTKPDPDHAIIDKPWEYEVTDLHFHRDLEEWAKSYVDLTLQKGDAVRRLRFIGPRDIQTESGFPFNNGGMEILDVRHRQMEGIGVRVGNFEAAGGTVTLWASEVIDLDNTVAA